MKRVQSSIVTLQKQNLLRKIVLFSVLQDKQSYKDFFFFIYTTISEKNVFLCFLKTRIFALTIFLSLWQIFSSIL